MEVPKRQENWITLNNTGLVEHYLRKEFCILVHFQVRKLNRKLLAFFQYHGTSGNPSPAIAIPIGIEGKDPIYCCDASEGGYKHLVLVDNVEAVEPPEGHISSLVWVDTPDRVDGFLPHALYLSATRSFLLCGRRRVVHDWETGAFSDGISISQDEDTSDMIQGTSEVMDGVAAGNGNDWRNGISLEDMDRWLGGLRFHIYHQGVRISSPETVDLGFDLGDMLFGPLDFLPNSR